MNLSKFQLKIIKYAIQKKLDISKASYEYWKNYKGDGISTNELSIVLIDIENDIKDYKHIIEEVVYALREKQDDN